MFVVIAHRERCNLVRRIAMRQLSGKENPMSTLVYTYAAYLLVSVAITVWVGRTLFRQGRIFLVDAMRGNETLADSVNHLLIVGFYLINVGYVTLALKYGHKPHSVEGAIEFFSTKIGLVLLVLGVMHFFNMYVLAQVRRRGLAGTRHSRRDYPIADVVPSEIGGV